MTIFQVLTDKPDAPINGDAPVTAKPDPTLPLVNLTREEVQAIAAEAARKALDEDVDDGDDDETPPPSLT